MTISATTQDQINVLVSDLTDTGLVRVLAAVTKTTKEMRGRIDRVIVAEADSIARFDAIIAAIKIEIKRRGK